MEPVTYITGLWNIPQNKKHDIKYYYRHIPKTFQLLKNANVVFFYEDNTILEYVKKHCNMSHFTAIKRSVCDLPTYGMMDDYLASCKNQDNTLLKEQQDDKGLKHYEREYMLSGEDSYKKVIGIWTSKLFLMEEIIRENPYKTDTFAWIDIGISRENPRYIQLPYKKNVITTNASIMIYKGERIFNAAGYMISDKNTWLKLLPLYKEKLEELRHSNYAHDEETIIYLIYKENMELFSRF